ncbi:hypothetical protein [Acetomicrobium sp.]|uniref:hypothetical protein n=1 Tax=Acetomicrobium sp. TaxID=1872099 RepID=UPI002FC76EFF
MEDDVKIPSHRGIPYEKIPLLKLSEVSARLIEEINKDKYNFILANFANGDIIGHTADFDAKVTCVNGIDKTLEDVVTAAIKQKYTVMITADHGVLESVTKTMGDLTSAILQTLFPSCLLALRFKRFPSGREGLLT